MEIESTLLLFVQKDLSKKIKKIFEKIELQQDVRKRLQFCYTANRSAVNPTAFCSVPFQDVIQKQF